MPATKSTKPSKKSIAALRANTIAKDEAFTRKDVVLASVEACLGNAQFRLKMADGSEGRGTPLGKFTFGTLRIAPGHVVICEPGKGVLTIIGRFDSHKDLNRLVKEKLIPRKFITGENDTACFEDGFEFDDDGNISEDSDEKDDEDLKISRILSQYKEKKQRQVNPMDQLHDTLEAEEKAQKEVAIDNGEIDYESRRFKRKAKKSVTVQPVKKSASKTIEEDEEVDFDHKPFVPLVVPDDWESFIDAI
jgi:translation initiation factor IF-1